ncbi:hypothetical protein PIN31115_04434 [Pandoraea iniqua]|uniref:Type IV / VI secretion system DotU domain-containing protein n=1 Tax=Pandoraea iniqua TaxID=2508288 RepID=A0A5E4YDI1_9BURK|nr:DotU family type IV/VI secretion system protein [Pandoraea iniqua]VVE46826.1 hypothetical protein PIN31115_04434 [Pandoraea iniqua]
MSARLANLWMPALQATIGIIREASSREDAAERIVLNLAQAQQASREAGYRDEQIDDACFAVVAWLDEYAATSQWSGRAAWRTAPLQRRYFDTAQAGETFFSRLEALPTQAREVREVYALVLLMGFQGKFAAHSRAALLDYRDAVLASLFEGTPPMPGIDEPLFGLGRYTQVATRVGVPHRITFAMMLVVLGPVIALLALALGYDGWLRQMAGAVLAEF